MSKIEKCCARPAISWKIDKDNQGTVTELQDLTGGEMGINLKRDIKKAINGRHCACEFGMSTMYMSKKVNEHIVDNKPSCTVELTLGMPPTVIKADVFQISMHKAGAHARLVVKEADITVKSGKL